MNYETEFEIQMALARWFDYHKCIIVPNLSWSMFSFELDIAILKPSGYLWEVEIKISLPDLKRDKEKHRYKNNDGKSKIRERYFAIPEKMKDSVEYIPLDAGIIIISKAGLCTCLRKSHINKLARKLSEKDKFRITRLNNIRYWRLESQRFINGGKFQ